MRYGKYFYPRSPCGERRQIHRCPKKSETDFYPRSPCGERHKNGGRTRQHQHFYPRSPCGERLYVHSLGWYNSHISIHALLAESDARLHPGNKGIIISIHALLAESDRQNPGKHYVAFRFLSTLSLRRATPRGGKLLS